MSSAAMTKLKAALSGLTASEFNRVGCNESGQGVVEYILIMVVMVGIIIGLLVQFNRAFETYANNLFGEYLTCLLETGELPALGGVDGASSVCAEFFSPFEPSGAALNSTGNSGANGGAQGSQGSDGSGSRDLDGRERQNRLSENRSGGGGAGSSRGGRFGRVGGYRPARGRGSNTSRGAGAGKGDGLYTGDTGVSSDSFARGRAGAPSRFLVAERGASMGYGARRQDDERKKPILVTNKKVSSKSKGSPKLFKVTRAPATSGEIKADGSGFGFGSFLRWLLILAIIIAIVLFFGGQALQISKSLD